MATVIKRDSNVYLTILRQSQTFLLSKVFPDKKSAVQWGKDMDKNVKKILSLSKTKLANMSPSKIEQLGGLKLFNKLGIDVTVICFNDLAKEYCDQWQGKDQNQIHRANFWSKILGNMPIKEIRTKLIRQELAKLKNSYIRDGAGNITNKKRSNNTVIRYKAVLSAVFKFAIEQGYISKNPVNGITIKATPNKVNRYLDDNERIALLDACKKSSWNRLYLLVLMAITTGMRKSELIKLSWADIDFDLSVAYLKDTKNGEPRLTPIPEIAMNELKKYRGIGRGLVFPSPTKPDRPFEFVKQWKNALGMANIKEFRFHDLRHTAASYLVMGGATLHDTAEILGHKSTETTKRYAHLSTQHKLDIANSVMGKVFKN